VIIPRAKLVPLPFAVRSDDLIKVMLACGSKVFTILMLPIFRPQGEKSAT
jgi:hypothetical protein